MDAEVPDGEVDVAVGEDLHEGVFAEAQRLGRGDLHPVAAGEELGSGLGDIPLTRAAAEGVEAKAGDEAGVGADVGADDDVTAIG